MEEERTLYPVVDIPAFAEEEDAYDSEYKSSLAWDLEKGDFVRDMSNRIKRSDGLEAYKVWCIKTVQTQRFSCLAYDDDIGTERDEAAAEGDDNAVELAMERTIEEALIVNPRTEAVEDFVFSWEPDALSIAFTVSAVGWESFPLEIRIDRG